MPKLKASAQAVSAALGGMLYSEDGEAGPLLAGARRLVDDRFLGALGGGVRKGLSDTVATMETGIRPRPMDKGGDYSLYDFEGHPYILTQSDRSAAGGEITSVHGQQIDPVDLRGGRDFMFDPPSEGMVWASDPGVVNPLQNRAGKLAEQQGKDTLLLPYSMAPTGIDFATMPLDVMIGYARSGMSKANIKKLDKQIKAVIPEWGGIANPDSVQVFGQVKGPKRKKIADIIDKQYRDVPGGMSISEARAATSDSAQYLSPEGQITNIGMIDSGSPVIAQSGHPTYKAGLPGDGVGTLQQPLDVRPFMANNGRVLAGGASDIRSLSMNHSLSQGVIDEKLLRGIYGGGAAAAVGIGATEDAEAGVITRGAATPSALAATALAGASTHFAQRRQEKKAHWRQLRQDLMSSASQASSLALDALDKPMQGLYGLGQVVISAGQGRGMEQSLMDGARVAQQPIQQTAYDIGGDVTDQTGSPELGYAANLAASLAGPI